MAGLRFVASGLVLYGFLRWRGVPAPSAAQWRNAAFVGLLLLGLGNGMVCIAEQSVSSGLAAVAVSSVPLWMALFAALRGEHPRRAEWIRLAATPVGLVALLVATIAWAYGSIWSRGRDLPQPFMAAAAQMLCGGAAMVVAGLAIGERLDDWPTAGGLWAVAYLASFGSLVG